MVTITRNVKDIPSDDRRALEHVFGQQLAENQRITISIAESESLITEPIQGNGTLPSWCNVFEGMSDAEIAEIEKIALTRAELSRTFE